MTSISIHRFICEILVLFSLTSPHAHRSHKRCHEEVGKGKPPGHSSRWGLGSIRAVCRPWRALEVFFSPIMDETIARGVSDSSVCSKLYLVPGILFMELNNKAYKTYLVSYIYSPLFYVYVYEVYMYRYLPMCKVLVFSCWPWTICFVTRGDFLCQDVVL